MRRRLTDSHDEIIDAIADRMSDLAKDDVPLDVRAFAKQYYRNVAADDLIERRPDDLAGAGTMRA